MLCGLVCTTGKSHESSRIPYLLRSSGRIPLPSSPTFGDESSLMKPSAKSRIVTAMAESTRADRLQLKILQGGVVISYAASLCPPYALMTSPRPMADHFALVPRAFAERFFLAIAAYYECDGESWPPPASWWQPACGGMAFEESVLFRHLHKELIPYHFYPHFEYAIARGTRGGKCDLGSSTYITACNLLSMANMFRFAPQEG